MDAGLLRIGQTHRGQRVLVHVAQRMVAEDAADAVDAGAGGGAVSADAARTASDREMDVTTFLTLFRREIIYAPLIIV